MSTPPRTPNRTNNPRLIAAPDAPARLTNLQERMPVRLANLQRGPNNLQIIGNVNPQAGVGAPLVRERVSNNVPKENEELRRRILDPNRGGAKNKRTTKPKKRTTTTKPKKRTVKKRTTRK